MIIAYGQTPAIITNQTVDIYLNTFYNNTITKQNLIDSLLSEIYDNRDGIILRHINNVTVDIVKMSNNTLVNEITEEGFYHIEMSCIDSDNNIGRVFWQDRNNSTGQDYIKVLIRENKPPVIFINETNILNLIDFVGNTITRSDIINIYVNNVIDDIDGNITPNILNIRIFKIGTLFNNGGTSFSPTFGSTGYTFYYIIPEEEVITITEIGEYRILVTVTDSLSATTVADFVIDAF